MMAGQFCGALELILKKYIHISKLNAVANTYGVVLHSKIPPLFHTSHDALEKVACMFVMFSCTRQLFLFLKKYTRSKCRHLELTASAVF